MTRTSCQYHLSQFTLEIQVFWIAGWLCAHNVPRSMSPVLALSHMGIFPRQGLSWEKKGWEECPEALLGYFILTMCDPKHRPSLSRHLCQFSNSSKQVSTWYLCDLLPYLEIWNVTMNSTKTFVLRAYILLGETIHTNQNKRSNYITYQKMITAMFREKIM